MKKEIERLKKQEAPYEVETSEEPTSGKKGQVTRRIVHKKGKKEAILPIV